MLAVRKWHEREFIQAARARLINAQRSNRIDLRCMAMEYVAMECGVWKFESPSYRKYTWVARGWLVRSDGLSLHRCNAESEVCFETSSNFDSKKSKHVTTQLQLHLSAFSIHCST